MSPATITDHSCLTTCGLTPRAWRRALVTLGVPHTRIGRRTVCTAAAWLAAVERASGATAARGLDREQIVRLAAGVS